MAGFLEDRLARISTDYKPIAGSDSNHRFISPPPLLVYFKYIKLYKSGIKALLYLHGKNQEKKRHLPYPPLTHTPTFPISSLAKSMGRWIWTIHRLLFGGNWIWICFLIPLESISSKGQRWCCELLAAIVHCVGAYGHRRGHWDGRAAHGELIVDRIVTAAGNNSTRSAARWA